MKKLVSLVSILTIAAMVNASTIANFDDISLGVDSQWSGNYTSDGTGGTYDTSYFNSGSAAFKNHSDGDWGLWAGFSYSNKTNTTTGGVGNQFSVYAGQAQSGENFGVGYQDSYNGFNPTVALDAPTQISGLFVTNTTYAALDMVNGSGFSKPFGGVTGDDEDWFLLTITGKDQTGASLGTIDFYLADYRFADNGQDYILDTWEFVDLSSLGVVKSLEFTLDSSDHLIIDGTDYGMNTPAYFAVDTIIPEPATAVLLGLGALVLRRKK